MALVLSRKAGESIILGDPIKPIGHITVIQVSPSGLVRIEIDLPRDIPVHRSEVAAEIRREALPRIVKTALGHS